MPLASLHVKLDIREPKNSAGDPGASLTTVKPTNHTTPRYTEEDIKMANSVPLGMAV